MSRYEIISDWSTETYARNPELVGDTLVVIQSANIRDTKNGQVYVDGAHRVVSGEFVGDMNLRSKDLKPVKKGKGGTVPFLGETAWSDAARLYDDTVFALQRATR